MRKPGFRFTFLFFLIAMGACKKNEPIPTADFLINNITNNSLVPCTVSFTNKSTNAFSYEWTLSGNDSVFSTDTNAILTFRENQAGSYDIKLRAFTQSRKEWASKIKTIKILKP